jgi:hypothetical protein
VLLKKIFAVGGLGETDINHRQIEVLDMDHLADGWQEINVDLPAGFCIALKTVKQLPSTARFTFIQKGRIGLVVF